MKMNKKILAGAVAGGLLFGGNAFASNYESTLNELREICEQAHVLADVIAFATSVEGASISDVSNANGNFKTGRDGGVGLFTITDISNGAVTITPDSDAAKGVLTTMTISFSLSETAYTTYIISNVLPSTGGALLPGFATTNEAVHSAVENMLDDMHCGESKSSLYSTNSG